MDIKTWAISLCVAALAGAIVQLLTPDTSLKKLMRFVTAAFFLSCLIAPVLTGLPEIAPAQGKAEQALWEAREGLRGVIDGQMEHSMLAQVRTLLEEKGVYAENISFSYNTADKNRISITQIDVVLSPSYLGREQELAEYLGGKTGAAAVLTFSDVS